MADLFGIIMVSNSVISVVCIGIYLVCVELGNAKDARTSKEE